MELLEVEEFLKKSQRSQVIFDVRSPTEYNWGHIPRALNLPLFSDEERHEVGLTYRKVGKEEAFLKGLSFVAPKMTQMVEKAWSYCGKKGQVFLYCARGGQRSQSVGWLLEKAGLKVYLLKKGYKAFRNFVLRELNQERKFLVIGGLTGSGKTKILQNLAKRGCPVIDLEGLANHRGSVFGHLGLDIQPTPMQFENKLALVLFSLPPQEVIIIEDESKLIGKLPIPQKIWSFMRNSSLLFLDVPLEERLKNILEEYGEFPLLELKRAIKQIEKRLGGEKTKEAILALEERDLKKAAQIVLTYYDKAYLYGLDKRPKESVIFVKEDSFEKRLLAIEGFLRELQKKELLYEL